MKFADKLFLMLTALLTLFFTVFGIWMLHSNFSRLLNREIEQGGNEYRMFQYLFEMGYRSVEEYGMDYAVNKTLDSVRTSVEADGSHIFVINQDGAYIYGLDYVEANGLAGEIEILKNAMDDINNYGYSICRSGENHFMLMTAVMEDAGQPVLCLGLCRDLNAIYDDRREMLTQYQAVLIVLLFLGGLGIYFLSRYITGPIRRLDKLAAKIAEGDYGLRSGDRSEDEIGHLARNFNRMADRLLKELEAKELEAKQKEDFTAAFAHELKTPLTSIIGYADMLNSMKLTEEENREAYFYIYSQGKRLESLSYKLLELVSMDKSPMSFKPVQTKSLEENIRNTVRPIWNERGLRGKIDLERAVLYGDEDLLLSLFYNLLDNAAKAMDKGDLSFILMKGRCVTGDGGADAGAPDPAGLHEDAGRTGGEGLPYLYYEIKVVDNGRGIPREEIGRVTEAFYMVDKSRSRKEGGAGIGMALCAKIAAMHGARLMIDSRLGEGTVMKLIFPMMHKKLPRSKMHAGE